MFHFLVFSLLIGCGNSSSSSSTKTKSSNKMRKVPFSQAIRIAEGCCNGGGGTWSAYDDCVGGNSSAISSCIGEFIMVSSRGEERKVSGYTFMR